MSISRRSIVFLVLLLTLFLGIAFRTVNIDKKIYWHDESYTTIRTTGYSAKEIADTIFIGRFFSPADLARFQTLKPGSTALDTIDSLAREDPQHPPFYFLLSRYWEKFFGFNFVSSRALPLLIGLACIPALYFLALELFRSHFIATLSAIFISLSPVDILFSQIARQYSLLTLLTILGQLFLLKTIRRSSLKNLYIYTSINVLGLYTHLFFGFNIIAQAIYLIYQKIFYRYNFNKFFFSLLLTILLYSPWLIIFVQNSNKAFNSTGWANVDSLDPILMIKLWMLSFSCLFTDIDFGFNNILTYIYRALFLIIIILAFYHTYSRDKKIFAFLFISSFVPFLILAIPDLILTTIRSSVTRYLISCFPTIYITVAYFFSDRLAKNRTIWKIILIILITNSLISNYNNALSLTTWAKPPSYWNGETAKKINAIDGAILISDAGEDWTNLGDILSLNYLLKPETRYFLTGDTVDKKKLREVLNYPPSKIFIFRPSKKLIAAFNELNTPLVEYFPAGQLWKI